MHNDSSHTPSSTLRLLKSSSSIGKGVSHFWLQRLTAILLLPFSALFIFALIRIVGGGPDALYALLAQPLFAILFLTFTLFSTVHMKVGAQVIIEDYVHASWAKILLIALNIFFCTLVAITSSYATLKICLGGA